MEGDPIFAAGVDITAARFFSEMRNEPSMRWAANTGERILLDLWKGEAAAVLRNYHACSATVAPSAGLNVPTIVRDQSLPMQRCSAMSIYSPRSEERRVGKECVSTCRSGWWP